MHWKLLVLTGIVFLILSLPAFIAQPADIALANFTLPVCLLFLGCLWIFAGLLSRKTMVLKFGKPDLGAALLLIGGMSLVIELVIRLLCSPAFGGFAAAMDFGIKCDPSSSRCDRNDSFSPSFNSFGHCVQGALSVLLLPNVENAAACAGAPRLPTRRKLILSLSSFVAAYPIYNVVKRAVRGPSGFASSSFSNNAAEWAMGFVLGLSVGIAGTAVAMHAATEAPTHVLPAPCTTTVAMVVRSTRVVAGAALSLVAVLTAILFGLSWDNVNTLGVVHEDDQDTAATIALLAVPIVLATLWFGSTGVRSACGCHTMTARPIAAVQMGARAAANNINNINKDDVLLHAGQRIDAEREENV